MPADGLTISIDGAASASLPEFNPDGSGGSVSFQVDLSDAGLVAGFSNFTASSPDGHVLFSAITTDPGNPYAGSVEATFYLGYDDFVVGDVPITITDTDALGRVATTTFTADITPVDPAPAILGLYDLRFDEGMTLGSKGTGSEAFTVDSVDPLGVPNTASVVLSATSSNPSLISSGDVSFTPLAGSPGYEELGLSSEAGRSGTATLTITAANGTTTTSSQIVVTVAPQNVYPVVAAPAALAYTERPTAQTLSIAFTAQGANGPPTLTVTDSQAPAGWQTPTIVAGKDGHYTARLALAPDTYASGNLLITATSPGVYGAISTTQTVAINGTHEHENFSVPAHQSFSLPEGDGLAVLTGFGSIPVTDPNGDGFSYAILNGPTISPTDHDPLYFVSNTGRLYLNGPDTWSASNPKADVSVFTVRVSNGAYTHNDVVAVHIQDASPPSLSLTETPASHAPGEPLRAGHITLSATDPHGLKVHFSIASQTDASGAKPYFIFNQANSSTGATGLILFGPPDAPHTSLADTLTITATDTQGLSASETISFFPDIIGGLTSNGMDAAAGTVDLRGARLAESNPSPEWHLALHGFSSLL